MKRICAAILILCLCCSLTMFCLPRNAHANLASGEALSPIRPLAVVRTPKNLETVDGIQPYADIRYGDSNALATADLSKAPGLAYSISFSNTTQFPAKDKLPKGYDPQALLEWGKYPGLHVDVLHAYGFTGKGAVIAYVDQPVSAHEQYTRGSVHSKNNTDSNSSMHGPAVLSLLTGKDIGTAPEAEVYFYGHASWKADQSTHAACLYEIIEQNKTLPPEKRISMVGFSDNPDPSEQNLEIFEKAIQACEGAGIMVWFCGEYGALTFVPGSDRDDPNSVVPESWWADRIPELVSVPAAGRTTASTDSKNGYIYWGEGGLSWTMPYVLGLYAIVHDIDPSLRQDDLRKMIVDTAYDTVSASRVINPVGFVAAALEGVGRHEEAQAMLDEVRAHTKYLYAVMETVVMSEEDLSAVGAYLASITDASVLIVDAARFSTVQSLYAAMKEDAAKRGGQIVGVQLFGTPRMVPSFEIQYKVQMENGVDEGGMLLTDLFYGNFNNDAALLTAGYNVMDHFAKSLNVDLIPQWPVARLPLQKGEFAAFFEKYDAFALASGLERLDIVNFSNPIFPSKNHIDDMGLFLERMDWEFGLLDIPYRLYGNLEGQYPVDRSVLGGFKAENMAAENQKAMVEFIINTHGQWNNIDSAIFVNGEEQRISLVNMDNINAVLADNPYYLDAWTCQGGYGMENNLTTTALQGSCVGMFSATAILSNNGVNWRSSLKDMARSNFYYFYYNYLKALHEGSTRSQAFFSAQKAYGTALAEDSRLPLRGEGNYQFNLYNLLAYHNFGVIDPNAAAIAFCEAKGFITQSAESVRKEYAKSNANSYNDPNVKKYELTDGNPVGESKDLSQNANYGRFTLHGYSVQSLDNGYDRFTLRYTAPAGLYFSIFDPPNGDTFMMLPPKKTGEGEDELVFDLSEETLASIKGITILFNGDVPEEERPWIYIATSFINNQENR